MRSHGRHSWNLLLAFCALSAAFATNARAETRFSVLGLQNYTNYDAGGTRASAIATFGGGLVFERAGEGSGHLEIGALYIRRAWEPTSSAAYLYLPLGFGMWFGQNVGASLGGYYAHGFGKARLNGVERSFAESSLSRSDFGATAALKLHIPFTSHGLSLHLESRYNRGLANITTAGAQSRFDDLLFLMGIRFGQIGPGAVSRGSADDD